MGGVFVLSIIWRLFFIFVCGYLLSKWFPITYPFHFVDLLVSAIINPLEFFAASIAFFFGLVVSAQLVQKICLFTVKIVKKKRSKP
jgi:hypothetical protein